MGSPFASLIVSDQIPLPFDDGQWVRVRKLTGRQHEAAQASHRADFVRGEKWAGVFRDALSQGVSSTLVQQAIADPLTGYDRYSLVSAGLVAWSYDKPIDNDAIDDLDDDAVEFIAREVLRLTKPGLFIETVEAAEEEKKNV